ncbi:MAG: sulfatase-like hydrolase/transferase [Bryobacterales bacterium]|nr:sulfatase-like hydrolase/transferase [Bryobacterales bacterium]
MNALTRRSFLGAGAASVLGGQTNRPPNLILILADDLGYGDLGCYGSASNRSPYIDKLASGGVRFTDFHSSGVVCSPTRAGLMTGRYQQRCGISEVLTAASNRDKGLDPAEITLPRLLKDAGYHTGIFGKWHLGYQTRFNPLRHGFDEFRGYVSGNVDYFSHVDQTGRRDWWIGDRLQDEKGYTTELVTRHAVDFIRRHSGRPFFLYLPHEAVHYPYQGPRDQPQRIPGRKPPATAHEDAGPVFREMLAAMDEGVGRVLDQVRLSGIENDTMIFFCSDNGAPPAGSNGPLRGRKGSVWEGGHRVPAIGYWPGQILAGKESLQTTISLDLMPTLLEAAGVPPPQRKLDGVSLLSHMRSGTSLGDPTLFWGHAAQRAMRQGRWKLTLMPDQDPFLAGLDLDLSEKTNLASRFPQRVDLMSEAIKTWEADVYVRPN